MSRDLRPSLATMLGRGLLRRCPRCSASPFQGFFRLADACPRCGMRFEREEGYWVGALIINTTVTFASFLVVFVGGILLLWPEIPWVALGIVTVAANLVIPVLFYPISKTLWVAMELSWHPLEDHELGVSRLDRD